MATTATTSKNPAKSAPAKETPAPKVDPLAGITVSVEDAPLPSITRNRDTVNPFLDAVAASKTDGKARGVVVAEDLTSRTVYLIRQAAERQNLGVRIVKDDPANGQVRIRFAAKDKRRVAKKNGENATAA